MSHKLFLLIVGVFLGLGVLGYLSTQNYPAVPGPVIPKSSPVVPPTGTSVTVSGVITCLLHRDKTGEQTLECALGLEAPDGAHYGLLNLEKFRDITTLGAGQTLTVTGTLDTGSTPLNTKYDVVGTIVVEGIESATSSSGIIEPDNPSIAGLAQVPDLPLTGDLTEPLSVSFVIEHRSALNGRVVRVKGKVASALLGDDACPTSPGGPAVGMCAQPRVALTDPEKQDDRYILTVLVSETEGYELYPIGEMVEIAGAVNGTKVGVSMFK